MRCRQCHYRLENLTERRCPECGRGFDPHDEATFDAGKLEPSTWFTFYRTSACVFAAILVALSLALRWLSGWQHWSLTFQGALLFAIVMMLGIWLLKATRLVDWVVWKIRRRRIDRS